MARLSPNTEVIRPDEEPVSKTGGGFNVACGFESHGFRSRDLQSRGPAATTPGLHPGNKGSIPFGTIY